jgi:WD40 repeat protein
MSKTPKNRSRTATTKTGSTRVGPNEVGAERSLRVPDHTLLRCIGAGSYGEVWLSRNVMGIHRAVKVVYRETFDDDRPYEREFNGIRLYEPVSRTHDDLIDILHVGRDDQAGYFYYVMELGDDETTGQEINPETYRPRTLGTGIVRQGRLPFDECLRLGISLSDGLAHLHRKGLIHRDLKPSNIVFVNGIAKIADIGLVAQAGSARSYVGTEGFMPPEGPGTVQADIYSLGKVLYELSSGKDRKTFPQLPTALEETDETRGYLELNEVILRACEDKPERRYASADAMNADLLLLQAGKSVRRLHQLESRMARLRRAALIGLGVALLVGAAYFQITRELQHATDRRHRQAGQLVASSTRLLEQRDYLGALPGYVAALALDGRDPKRAETHRTRIARVLDQSPSLVSYWMHGRYVHGAALSHDGRWSALAADDGSTTVWDMTGGDEPLWRLAHEGSRQCVVFRGDDQALAVGGRDGFTVWNLDGAEPTVSFDVSLTNTTIYGIAYNPTGDQLITAGYERTTFEGRVDLWDAHTGEAIVPFLARADDPFRHPAFSLDGRRVVVVGEYDYDRGWSQLLDPTTGAPIGDPVIYEKDGWVLDANFSPDGRTFVTASLDRTARICDAHTGEQLQVLRHPAPVRTARFSPDGRYVVTGGSDSSTRIWDVTSGQQAFPPLKDQARHLVHAAFVADGRRVVTVSATSGTGLWDLSNLWDLSARHRPPLPVRRVFSDSGDRAARLVSSSIVIETIGGERQYEEPLLAGFPVHSAIFTRDGTGLLAYSEPEKEPGQETEEPGQETRRARYWLLRSGDTITVTFQCDDGIQGACLSDDGRWLVTCLDYWFHGKTVDAKLHDLSASQAPSTPMLAGSKVQFARFNHASDRLAIASEKRVTLWDLPPGPEPRLILDVEDVARYVAFSPDDRRMVIACHSDGRLEGRSAHVYDTATGRELLPPLRHGDGVLHAEFSPDGRKILTAGEDYQARIWDSSNGQLLVRLDHPDQVLSARFSHDSRWIATVCRDERTRVWEVETGEPITPPLQQPWPAATAWFVDDTDFLVTRRRSGETIFWPLTRDPRPLKDLIIFARKLSGRQVPHTEHIWSESRQSLLEEWKRIQAESLPHLSASGGRAVEWHHYHAELSEAQQSWHAAVFHWTRLTSLEPHNPGWSERLDAARTRADSAE